MIISVLDIYPVGRKCSPSRLIGGSFGGYRISQQIQGAFLLLFDSLTG